MANVQARLQALKVKYEEAISARKQQRCILYRPSTWCNPSTSQITYKLHQIVARGNALRGVIHLSPVHAAKCNRLLAGAHMQLAYLNYEARNSPQVHDHFRQAKICFDNYLPWATARPRAVRLSEEKPYAETSIGILLSSPINPEHNLGQALQYFRRAEKRGCKHAKYWRGRALLNGFGVQRDTNEGFKLIQEAAGAQVRRALFETAALHEEGCEGIIRKNPVLAIEYYDAVAMSADNRHEWVWDYAMAHLHNNREFHETENIIGTFVGSLFSWEFAGQAFLFGGVATLAATSNTCPELEHYDDLLILLPVIGIVVALLSLNMSIHTLFQNSRRRDKLVQVYEAKLKACEELVGPRVIPNWWKNLTILARIAKGGEIVAVLLALTFLSAWSVLLR